MGDGPKTQTQTAQNQNQQQQQQQQAKVEPWVGQQGPLLDAFAQAKALNSSTQPGYTGDFVAQPTNDQIGVFQQALRSGSENLGATGRMVNYGDNIAQAGVSQGGQAMGGLFGLGTADPTDRMIESAGKFSDNPNISGMVTATMRDANRAVAEQALPGIIQNAAATGNLNSNRRGIAEGIVERGLAEKTADVSANLRGQAYSQGLGLAGDNQNRMLEAFRSAGGLANNATSTGLGAMQGGVQAGLDATNTANLASANLTAAHQAPIDNAFQKDQFARELPWSDLQKFYNIIGGNNWGSNSSGSSSGSSTGTSTGNGTSQTTPSTMQNLGMGAAIMGSLFRSDARTKNLIKVVGKTAEGLDLYLYTYKDDPGQAGYVAPLAQDVQKMFPDAVVDINGTLFIDTSKYDWR